MTNDVHCAGKAPTPCLLEGLARKCGGRNDCSKRCQDNPVRSKNSK
jgi:hypothetical protein